MSELDLAAAGAGQPGGRGGWEGGLPTEAQLLAAAAGDPVRAPGPAPFLCHALAGAVRHARTRNQRSGPCLQTAKTRACSATAARPARQRAGRAERAQSSSSAVAP
jgi:hypothetical protein